MRLIVSLRDFGRRHRVPIVIVGSIVAAAAFVSCLPGARRRVLDGAVVCVASDPARDRRAPGARARVAHRGLAPSIEAAGGEVSRRVLFRASSVQVVGSVFNGHLGVAARIAALRRSSPDVSPQVPTLIAAEFPILAVEAVLAAAASFTLIGPLNIPWWVPIIAIAVISR